MIKILKKIINISLYIAIFAALVIAFILITEFSPKNGEELKVIGKTKKTLKVGDTVTLLTYNIGHLISDREADCFLEGGSMVKAKSEITVRENLDAIKKVISDAKVDIVSLQEVDYKSSISHKVNEYIELANDYEGMSSIALFQNTYVPYPYQDMVGKVKSGIAIMSAYEFTSCRINLPGNYEFPERIFMPKKAIQKQVVSIEETDKKLVVLNIELEDYDNGSVRTKQLAVVKDEMLKEYNLGNYVVVTGDFNMTFPGVDNTNNSVGEFIVTNIPENFLPEGWNYGIDKSINTFRLRNEAYNKEKSFTAIVDGFIVSPNVTIKNTKSIDTEFKNSNHNPVKIEITLNK